MIIGICGGTGSGKTTVANRILESVSKDEVVFLQQDSYYRNLDQLPLDIRNVVNFDHPDAIDNDLLISHLRALKQGRAVELPLYDFKTHSRRAETLHVEPQPIIIIEGILIFAEPRLLDEMDIKVYVDTPDDIRFIRRLRRDAPSSRSSSSTSPPCGPCTRSSSSPRSAAPTSSSPRAATTSSASASSRGASAKGSPTRAARAPRPPRSASACASSREGK
jgi:uridine kinase